MPVRHIQRHAELTFTGDETIPEHLALTHEHRTSVLTRYADTFGVTAGEPTP
jgi:hypothetical protein